MPEPDSLRRLEEVGLCRSAQIAGVHPDQAHPTIPPAHLVKDSAKQAARCGKDLAVEIGGGLQASPTRDGAEVVMPELQGDRLGEDLFIPKLRRHPGREQRKNLLQLIRIAEVA